MVFLFANSLHLNRRHWQTDANFLFRLEQNSRWCKRFTNTNCIEAATKITISMIRLGKFQNCNLFLLICSFLCALSVRKRLLAHWQVDWIVCIVAAASLDTWNMKLKGHRRRQCTLYIVQCTHINNSVECRVYDT